MSSNFVAPRASELKTTSDTISEISESGTGTSGWTSGWDSREDLRDLVYRIGLQDISDLYQDRFRINRKKLEHMLIGDDEAPEPADTFFHKIMEDTNTHISWPSKLKIGAKSKKDPHVRIAGRPEDVKIAKDRIMSVLDTTSNRVTMKMDVSYTDHSHIIGKGGLTIKRVMEETKCHVHFPDSNRLNLTEKSNQVSIAGDIKGVEKARSRVRNLTPLIFCFELPIISSVNKIPDANTHYVIKIQQQYNVQVMFRTRPKLHATLVMVKGAEWEVHQVQQATILLVEFMCENLSSQIPIQMSMEISPHYHSVVTGNNHSNLKAIMQRTNTQIMFPDAQDPNVPSLKKSNITISGNVHNVYAARQQLMGSLPLMLMFDLPADTHDLPINSEQIAKIQCTHEVVVNIRHKTKQNTLACIIKGIERNATKIYEARNHILNTTEPKIIADISTSYFPPSAFTTAKIPSISVRPMSPLISPLVSPSWNYTSNAVPKPAPFVGMTQQPQFMYNTTFGSVGTSGYKSMGMLSGSSFSMDTSQEGTLSTISSTSPMSSPMASPRNVSPMCHRQSESESPSRKSDFPSFLSEMNASGGYHGPTIGKMADMRQNLTPSDYEQKRLSGIKAMQSRITTAQRVPTGTWAGYGISRTSPGTFADTEKDEDIWRTPTSKQNDFAYASTTSGIGLNCSNSLDQAPATLINCITTSKWTDLSTLLTSLGLEKYIPIFASSEVDLLVFRSMGDRDLIDIGVTAFGARRKMLLAISELNKRYTMFSAAPGAERKSSSSTASNHSSPKERL